MRPTRPSMQELIGRRKRAGFVGRRSELDLFRANFGTSPEDERHSFVFHIHGTAGVGKSSLVRELEAVAAQRKALTACTDETVNSVPEVMAAISAQFEKQGAELKALDKLLVTYRQRRHEAETASAVLQAGPDPGLPSPGSMAVSQAGLIGLGMVPVVGAFAGAIDPAQVAHSTDRLKAALSARFRNHDDVQLVLDPLKVLTPVFVAELERVAAEEPWVALFFDTYERTAPFLDPWLLDLITTDRYGALPANMVVTLAGQHGPDPARWADYAGFVTEFVLEPFTESEARQLLAAKRVVDENAVREVLRLSEGLPVLVSMLAENPGAVDDPTATAVERFLKWERDPARRDAALACAVPRWLNEDVFRVVVGEGTEGSYEWLRGLPFVGESAGRIRYHDVVRTAMLRLRRTRSGQQWTAGHARLAEAYGEWRAEAEEGLEPDELWSDGPWRELRMEESYHLLCASPRTALPQMLRDVVGACRAGEAAARGCAQVLADAGEHADAQAARTWGQDLLAALSDESEGTLRALGLLLNRAGLDAPGRAEAHCVRGHELRWDGEHERALAEYDRAIALAPESAEAYSGRALAHRTLRDLAAALADVDRADALNPDTVRILGLRGDILQGMARYEDAVAAFDRVLDLDPGHTLAKASRGQSKHFLGDDEGALADFDEALQTDPEYLWALVHRAELYRDQRRMEESFADLDRAVEIAPDSAWIASERGDAYRLVGRNEEAVAELGRACELDPDYSSTHAGRGYALARLGRHEEARAAYDRAIEVDPAYPWALVHRALLRGELGDEEGMFADLDSAVSADGTDTWALNQRAFAYRNAGRYLEAMADYGLGLRREPDLGWGQLKMVTLVALSEDDAAVAELDRALQLDPDDVDLLASRGVVCLRRGQYAAALRDLDRAISLRPDMASLNATRARACIAIGRHPQALADLARCVERGEEPAWATRRTAEVLLWCGHYDEARQLLDELGATGGREGDAETVTVAWYFDSESDRWERARNVGDLMAPLHFLARRFLSVVSQVMSGDLSTAEPVRRFLRQVGVQADGDADATVKFEQALVSCAVGDWSRADSLISGGLALDHDWEDLADLTLRLTLLARSPNADPALFGPRLARVTAARDAFQARYAE
ncbi:MULTISPECIES: tetratricopeptide repeat protein [unclassified Streptomyces]|uniref:tetratricopeptide repeat protein n=1 Tax=unclassified Streptomyces TaxID=2593676 RepID=UPI002366D746|nr:MULTISPECIES: tetratricopeptide repeat protein [unclassified Streptomyces]MDF3141572.1 tetratricopeptide repeat protein [Streptomyces sp. T21Q-yed]WDF38989.1 tetratricopeptide repeat protein [Streptomyces sp. T12]